MPGKREKSAKEGVGAQNVTTINKLRKMLSLRNSLQSLAKLSGAQKDMTLSGASGTCKRGSGKEVVGPAMHASGDEEIEQLKAFRERVKADVAGAETGVSLKAAPRHKYASSYGVDDFALTMSDAEDGRKRASSLHLSAAAGDIVAVRQMIEDGCDVNEHDKKYSSLHMAVRTADQDMVQLLLDSGAIIDKRDRDGWAPLHVACMLVRLAVIDRARIRNACRPLNVYVFSGVCENCKAAAEQRR